MSSMDTTPGNTSICSINEDSVCSTNVTKTGGGTNKKHHQQHFSQMTPQRIVTTITPIVAATTNDDRDKTSFYRDLYHFHETKG